MENNQWVLASDRLPEDRQKVLIIQDLKNIYQHSDTGRPEAIFLKKYSTENVELENVFVVQKRDILSSNKIMIQDVLYWMPKPKLPELPVDVRVAIKSFSNWDICKKAVEE